MRFFRIHHQALLDTGLFTRGGNTDLSENPERIRAGFFMKIFVRFSLRDLAETTSCT